jgi:hypothetical protein
VTVVPPATDVGLAVTDVVVFTPMTVRVVCPVDDAYVASPE